MTLATVVKGDYGYYLNFTVTYALGSAYDLSGQIITLKIADPSSNTNLFTAQCDIVSAMSGNCRYQMTEANAALLQCQVYKAELEITAGTATVFTVPNIYLLVVTDMPAG